jgi:hypothetical protein
VVAFALLPYMIGHTAYDLALLLAGPAPPAPAPQVPNMASVAAFFSVWAGLRSMLAPHELRRAVLIGVRTRPGNWTWPGGGGRTADGPGGRGRQPVVCPDGVHPRHPIGLRAGRGGCGGVPAGHGGRVSFPGGHRPHVPQEHRLLLRIRQGT